MTRRPWRIFVDHGESNGELGDEAVLLAALERLREYLGPCEFILPMLPGRPRPARLPPVMTVASPSADLRQTTVELHLWLHRWPLLRHCNPPDWLIWRIASWWTDLRHALHRYGLLRWPGTSLLRFIRVLRGCDAFYGVGAADFSDRNLVHLVYKAWLYRFVRRYVPISVLSAQAIGRLEPRWARRCMASALGYFDLISFRDGRASREFVTRRRLDHVRHEVVGDEAFTLPAAHELVAQALLQAAGLKPSQTFVAVHFDESDGGRRTASLVPRIAGLLDAIAEVVPHQFIFVPMRYNDHVAVNRQCASAIRTVMRRPERLLTLPGCRDVTVIKRVVALARYTLGLDYHVHVFSLSQGHPAIVLHHGDEHRCQSEGLIGFYEPPNAAIDLQVASDADVIESVRRLEACYPNACLRIAATSRALRQRNDWALRELALLLKQRNEPARPAGPPHTPATRAG